MFVFFGGNPKSAKYVCVCSGLHPSNTNPSCYWKWQNRNIAVAKKSCTILDGWHLINRLWIVGFTTYQLVRDFAQPSTVLYPLVNVYKITMLLMGKSTINSPFSIAMLNFQRVSQSVKMAIENREFTHWKWWFSIIFVCLPEGIFYCRAAGHTPYLALRPLKPSKLATT